jgi:hypothetical protein
MGVCQLWTERRDRLRLDPIQSMDFSRDLPRIVLSVLFIGTLLALSIWILRPFLACHPMGHDDSYRAISCRPK